MKRNTITRLCSLAAAAALAVSCIALTGCGSSASSAASSTASTAASAAAAGGHAVTDGMELKGFHAKYLVSFAKIQTPGAGALCTEDQSA